MRSGRPVLLVGSLVGTALVVMLAPGIRAAPQPDMAGSASSEMSLGGPLGARTPQDALDRMDTRVPVPLLPMMANQQKERMRNHLLAVQEIVLALARDDFAEVERAATRIGYSEATEQMCRHMGAGARGLSEVGLKFHRTADTIAAAARRHDRSAALQALGATLQSCTGCHASFRQQVVDLAGWRKATEQSSSGAPRSED